jgi:hypothetical protein
MAKFAILDVFSGVPNPAWPIDDDLAQRMAALTASESTPPGLGYRGILLVETDSTPSAPALTVDALGTFTQTTVVFGNADAEKELLGGGLTAGAISQNLFQYVSDSLGGPALIASRGVAGGGACPPCGGVNAPSYNPGYWNDPTRQPVNNCYAYANNNATGTFPQPGRGSGQMFTSLDCDGVRTASGRDGLVTTTTYQASRSGWYVALVIWPGQDYHWYRQDDVGCWSHKPGRTPARNVDNSLQSITDPQQCDRGPYTVFCTYMVTDASVTIS